MEGADGGAEGKIITITITINSDIDINKCDYSQLKPPAPFTTRWQNANFMFL